MDYYDCLRKKSYFVRMIFWDDDEDCEAPIFIKMPESVLAPSREIRLLIEALEEFFDLECFVVLSEVEETSEGPQIIPIGPEVNAVLLVTTWMDDVEVISGIITPGGEHELLCLDSDGSTIWLEMSEDLVAALGLEYVDHISDVHRAWLIAQGYYDEDVADNVYFPNFIYN